MKRFHFIFLLFLIFSCTALAQQSTLENRPVLFSQPLSPRIAGYDIRVRLDTEKRLLHGKEILHWRNDSKDVIRDLQFHLYLNAFRNSESTFMKESGGVSRGNKIDKDGWGFSKINSVTLPNGEELIKNMEFIHPDDDNEHDKTVVRIELNKPLPPGKTIDLNIDFTAKLPSPPFARTGAQKEYFFAGQWFPKIGVYQDGGWNCHQFHANSEFFADYGNYNVWITVPNKNIVGATGLEVNVKQNDDGTATHYYHAEDVHDFAWTTSPEFKEFTGEAQGVKIRLLMQPDHAYQAERHLAAAKVALDYFHKWYGTYPFPNLTIVDPRRGAAGSGGMEYPTLITAGTAYGIPKGLRMVEMVIIHEFGHNYWYHLIASNEFEEPWMDEGINSYSESQIIDDYYGPAGSAIDLFGIKMNDLQVHRMRYLTAPDVDKMVETSWGFYSGNSYGTNSYSKPAVVLTTLQNYLGKEKMLQVMHAYFERWKFKHPKTQDFIDVVDQVSGRNLDWYFNQAFFSNAELDYSVDRVSTRKLAEDKGFDYNLSVEKELAGKDSTSDSTAAGSGDLDSTAGASTDSTEESSLYVSRVNIRRLGDFIFPVELQVVFDNGDTLRENWDGKNLWKKYRYVKPAKLVSATVDPDYKIPLDINYTNNSKMVKKPKMGVNKLAIRFLFWMQFLMDQPEFLNLFSGLKRGA